MQSASPGRFLALLERETEQSAADRLPESVPMPVQYVSHRGILSWRRRCFSFLSRAFSASEKVAMWRKRIPLLTVVCLLLLMSLSLSQRSTTTSATSSPLTIIRASPHPSLSPSATLTVESSLSHSTPAGKEATAVPLTLVDLIGTLVGALIPALLGGIFIAASRYSRRRRERPGWSGQAQLVQVREELDWQVEVEEVDSLPGKQEELHEETQDDALRLLLLHAPLVGESAHSRLSRLKHRLHSLQDPVLPQ